MTAISNSLLVVVICCAVNEPSPVTGHLQFPSGKDSTTTYFLFPSPATIISFLPDDNRCDDHLCGVSYVGDLKTFPKTSPGRPLLLTLEPQPAFIDGRLTLLHCRTINQTSNPTWPFQHCWDGMTIVIVDIGTWGKLLIITLPNFYLGRFPHRWLTLLTTTIYSQPDESQMRPGNWLCYCSGRWTMTYLLLVWLCPILTVTTNYGADWPIVGGVKKTTIDPSHYLFIDDDIIPVIVLFRRWQWLLLFVFLFW